MLRDDRATVASSDATNIASSIVSDENNPREYVLNGRKWWTSGACDPRCALAIFMGKTAPDGAAPKHKQQSMVLVAMRARRARATAAHRLRVHDAPHGHAEVTFTDVRVNKQSVLLGEGRGFEIAQGRLGPGRLHHCMRLIGMGERALRLLASAAPRTRVAFGKPLAAGNVLQTLERDARDFGRRAPRHLGEAARRLDEEGNKTAKGAIAACKVAPAPKRALFVIDAAIQLHGGLGVCDEPALARMFARQDAGSRTGG